MTTWLPSYLEQPASLYRLEKARKRSTPTFDNIADHLYILDKRDQMVRFVPNRVQQHYRQHRTRRNLILKSRQQGLSTLIQADQFLAATTSTVRCATLAHDDTTTQYLRRMAKRFWQSLPEDIRPRRALDNASTTLYESTGSEVTIATAGSTAAGRGGTNRRVHGSEVAFWKDAGLTMAGIMQSVPSDGIIELESTPNGAQGWFYERCMEALDGNSDWTLHFFPWWHDDAYTLSVDEPLRLTDEEAALVQRHRLTDGQIAWRRKKQRELGRLFAQEYPEDPRTCFLTSGDGYFADIHDIDRVFTAPPDAKPDPDRPCVASIDFGQMNDYFAMSIIDPATLEERELLRINQMPWGDMRARARELCQKWHVRTVHPEVNSMGSTNIEELHKEFKQHGLKTTIQPFDMNAQTKSPAVTAFHWAIDEGGLKLLPDPIGRQEINTFKASQTPRGAWMYEGKPHDDTVVARIICWHGVANGTVTLGRSTSRWA